MGRGPTLRWSVDALGRRYSGSHERFVPRRNLPSRRRQGRRLAQLLQPKSSLVTPSGLACCWPLTRSYGVWVLWMLGSFTHVVRVHVEPHALRVLKAQRKIKAKEADDKAKAEKE